MLRPQQQQRMHLGTVRSDPEIQFLGIVVSLESLGDAKNSVRRGLQVGVMISPAGPLPYLWPQGDARLAV